MNNWMRIAVVLGGLGAGLPAAAADLDGELDWVKTSVSVPVSGRVDQIAVRPGDAVDAGQILLRFDTRVAKARAAEARSAVKRLELQRAEAQREWERAKELFDRTVLSVRELQLAEIGYHAADAEYQTARAAQVATEVELDYLNPVAPFAARVLAVHAAPGQAVINAQQAVPLVTLAERGRLQVRAAATAEQLATLASAPSIGVRVGDQRYEGRLREIGAEPQGSERPARYAVAVEFAVTDDTALRPGQGAVLVLP